MPEEIVLVISTVPRDASERIASAMVEERLVACVNAASVRSRFFWKGECSTEEEDLLIMKTRKDLAHKVMARLQAIHPYDVPEILIIPVLDGYRPYLEWVRGETVP
ncbi:MAG: divalent-cation tolerance protein CutA [Methanomicrobiales archaeon]|jgi:periplasmic divalent cation tolerance protein|nr:divalent-cation tolerance protein CutA [Methanomicrobiales archaeon]MDD1647289.1 divalent-cation tolerance protein CutA [Methanomicrobiales archaeon]